MSAPGRHALARIAGATLAALLLPAAALAAQGVAYVLTSDYTSGSMSQVDLSSRAVSQDVAAVYSDARMRTFGGLIYVVNRFGQDNIQVLDPAQGFATLRQFSVGNGSNPQDICVVTPTKAYVTRLASPRLLIVNPATGDSLGAVSLAAFADADGLPDMDRMFLLGSRLFVSLERLSNFQPTDSSLVAVVDVDADTVVDTDPATAGTQAILLPGTNPVTPFVYDAARVRLLIGCVGHYGALDGGVASVDPQGLTSPGFAISEAALGGDVLDLAGGDPERAFAIVSDASYNTAVVAWSAASAQKLGTVFSTTGFYAADIALDDRGELYVCDNDPTAPGLFVFAAASGVQLAGPLDTGLPPVEVAFDVASGYTPSGAGEVSLSMPWPQPAQDHVRLEVELAHAGDARVTVLDVTGRRVRSLAAGAWGAGVHALTWDGRDDAGDRVPAGVYVLGVSAGGTHAARNVVIMP